MIVWREIEYLIKWKDYNSKYDVWKNLSKLKNIMNLIQKYENSIRHMIDLSNRHRLSKSIMLKKFFANQNTTIFVNNKFIFKKSFNQDKAIFVDNKFIIRKFFVISSSIFALKLLIVVSRKFQISLISSFETLMLRRSNRLIKNWKIFEKELLLEKTYNYELIETKLKIYWNMIKMIKNYENVIDFSLLKQIVTERFLFDLKNLLLFDFIDLINRFDIDIYSNFLYLTFNHCFIISSINQCFYNW
jgi:hypothetical protein